MSTVAATGASSTVSSKLLLSIGIGVGVTMLSGGLAYWYHKYWKRDAIPERWRRVGTLEQLNLFPVKSTAPLKLDADAEVEAENLGLRLHGVRDRALMIVDDEYKMVTARVYPRMVLIESKILGENKIVFSAPNMLDELVLDFATMLNEAPGKDVHTCVWEDKLDAMLCGEKYDKWFSKCILNKDGGLHLVYYPYPKPVRSIRDRQLKEPHVKQTDTGAFPDATSYMLINLASVDELNTRLSRPVNALQFRGNFNLKMDEAQPYAEDNWNWIKIGNDAVFRVVAPCTRCIFPNINAFTGERDPESEPLKTLNKYRKWPRYSSAAFGSHLGLRLPGIVKPNDVVYVEDK